MASSETEICNLAISHLGISKEIAFLTTDRSDEASACRRYFKVARNQTIRDFSWPFATKFVDLALVEADPTDEWAYAYRYPSDCAQVRRILSGIRMDNSQSRVPYRVGQDDDGLLIYTDAADASLEYTKNETNVSRFPDDFVMALSFRLAVYIAPRITGGDPFKMGDRAAQFYAFELDKAKTSALNEEQSDQSPDSEYTRIRE